MKGLDFTAEDAATHSGAHDVDRDAKTGMIAPRAGECAYGLAFRRQARLVQLQIPLLSVAKDCCDRVVRHA